MSDQRSARFFCPLSSQPHPRPSSLPSLPLTHNPSTLTQQPSAFEGEDEEDDDDEGAGPAAPAPQPKKKAEAKTYTKGTSSKALDDDEALDDPLAEKLRRQRLVEEADLEMAKELFGTATSGSGAANSAISKAPATAKEAEEHGRALVAMFLAPHSGAAQYKNLVKAAMKAAMQHLDAPACKELEAAAAAVRAEKVKADAAAKAAAGLGNKSRKTLNMGRSGGAAGLDDYVYDDPLDDEVDFM